jgi:hypothetical protein
MISISFKVDIDDVRRQFLLQQEQISKAAARALNRTADGTRAQAITEVSVRTKLKVTQLRKRFAVNGANPQRLQAIINAYGYSPNLGQFNARQTKPGVTAKAWEGSKVYRHSFMVNGKVVARVGKGRFPLKGLRGPSSPQTFKTDAVTSKLIAYATGRFAKEFAYEWQRRLGVSA